MAPLTEEKENLMSNASTAIEEVTLLEIAKAGKFDLNKCNFG